MGRMRKFLVRLLSVLTVGILTLSTACTVTFSDVSESSIGDHEHVWGEYEVITFTCENGGEKQRKCLHCEEVESEILYPGHVLQFTERKNPTCMSEGRSAGYYCLVCEYDERTILSPVDHSFENGYCVNPGCGQEGATGGEDEPVDVARTILTVSAFNGGAGHEWIEEAAKRFEELYADVSFEYGKKGVDVVISYGKNSTGAMLAEKQLTGDVYFTEYVDYYTFVARGKVADITDVVTGSMEKFGETGTIEDKLDEQFKDYLTAFDAKYYMLPFYDGFHGFTYDVDLFEQEGFYFDEYGDFVSRYSGESQGAYDAKKSAGPDGVKGTYDDGLPQTYDQFIELCDYMLARGIIPFCFSGIYNDYVNRAFLSFAVDYEGEAFKLNYTLRGTNVELANVDASGKVTTYTEPVITPDNAYLLKKQAGNYYALMMQEKLFSSNKYSGGMWNAYDYIQTQREFIMSKYTDAPYAMLVEGVWWENEATHIFDDMYLLRGESKTDRRFGFMPMPKADDTRFGNQTMFSANSSFAFINADSKQMELAKEFMRFLHTDAEMSKFTSKTSITRSLNYEVTAEDRENATHFGKSVIDMKANSTIIYPYSVEDLVFYNADAFTDLAWYFTSVVYGQTRNNPFAAFKNGDANAITYFNGLFKYQEAKWGKLYMPNK